MLGWIRKKTTNEKIKWWKLCASDAHTLKAVERLTAIASNVLASTVLWCSLFVVRLVNRIGVPCVCITLYCFSRMKFHFIPNKTSCRHSALGTRHSAHRTNRLNTVQCLYSIYWTSECERSFFLSFVYLFACLLVGFKCAESRECMNVTTIRSYRIHCSHFFFGKTFCFIRKLNLNISLISIRCRYVNI